MLYWFMEEAKEVGSQPTIAEPDVRAFHLKAEALIPNNSFPLLVYARAFVIEGGGDPAAVIERTFRRHGWSGTWRNGIYAYHHYHSTAHEVLGVFRGAATVQFGGDSGRRHQLKGGDVVIIPAGVAHKSLESSDDFGVVGAYPSGQEPDLWYAQPGERPKTDNNIARVPLPNQDPVFGARSPLLDYWRR
jgi:uncharacterized protein YjlB